MNFHQYIFSPPYCEWLCRGVAFTVWIALLTAVFAMILGVAVCILRISSQRYKSCFGAAYIGLFRNIPPVPLLLLLVFGFPGLYRYVTGSDLTVDLSFSFLILGLSLNTSAYIADILRSGIKSIPESQIEAGKVLGLSKTAIIFRIILPQAVRVSFPALETRLIHNMKNSSVSLVLPLHVESMEVMGQAGRIAGQTFSWAEPLVFASVVYLALSLILSSIVKKSSSRLCGNLRKVT